MSSPDSQDPVGVARLYLAALQSGDREALESLLARDIVYREMPNRLNPQGSARDRTGMLDAFEHGAKVVSSQRFEIERSVVQGQTVALEVVWTGTLSVPVGSLAAGDTMRARFAMFLDVRDGQIARQHNYDCFDAF